MEPVGTDFPATIATPGTVAVGGTARGTIDRSGDQDWFAVTLQAGQIYRFTLAGLTTGAGTIGDPYFSGVHTATGVLQPGTTDDDGGPGLDSSTTFTPAQTGTFYLAAAGYSDATGSYALSVYALADLAGGPGDDWLVWRPDTLSAQGGAGRDTLSFAGAGLGVSVRLWNGDAAFRLYEMNEPERQMTGIENITGSRMGDVFAGGGAGAVFRGLAGNDRFEGEDAAAVRYDGGAGRDTLDYGQTDATGVSASLLRGRGWAGDAAGDRFVFIEDLSGTAGHDTLTGDHGGNVLTGQGGADILTGNGGNDTLQGGEGRDIAVFSFAQGGYVISRSGNLTRVTGGDGIDDLYGIEVLRFADGDLIL